jgi:hypothetical protein
VATREQLDAATAAENAESSQTIGRARLWMRAPLLDTSTSFFFVILVTLLFGILGTLVLHPRQAIPANDALLSNQESFLVALHPGLEWLYRVAVFFALVGTIYGAFEVYRYTMVESVRSIVPRWTTEQRERIIRAATVAYCFIGGQLLIWLPVRIAGTIINRMTFGTIISGAATCGLWCFAMIWLDHVRLPKALRMSWTTRILAAVAGAVMTFLGVQTMVAYFR